MPKRGGMTKAGDVALVRELAPSAAVVKLINEALAIEAEEAREAGALGFMARALVQATMPHRKPEGNEFERRNGAFTLTMWAPRQIGLPYGSVPRLVLAWLTTEAVRTKERHLVLGDSLSDFMRQIGQVPTGGRWGTIARVREQTRRLFTSAVACTYEGRDAGPVSAGKTLTIADDYRLWWTPKNPEQAELFASTVTISEAFFAELIERPVPIDLRVLKVKAISRSPLALDLYVWLSYRMSYLRRDTVIPWEALKAQFGADYERTRAFKAALVEQLRKVLTVYRGVRAEPTDNGLLLRPSPPHVRRIQE